MDIHTLLGDDAESLLDHECKTFERDSLTLPGPDFVDRVLAASDRSPQVLRSIQSMFGSGRLAGT
ncbi:MAG: fructose-bisphosphate aldolase, partial [Acidimicrobiaceae bacterium]|nr:fructose-bisphosphate aldolase [Acidimicrobiaceae bacterium]